MKTDWAQVSGSWERRFGKLCVATIYWDNGKHRIRVNQLYVGRADGYEDHHDAMRIAENAVRTLAYRVLEALGDTALSNQLPR